MSMKASSVGFSSSIGFGKKGFDPAKLVNARTKRQNLINLRNATGIQVCKRVK